MANSPAFLSMSLVLQEQSWPAILPSFPAEVEDFNNVYQLFTLTISQINTLTETFIEMDAIVTKAEIAALPKKAEDQIPSQSYQKLFYRIKYYI